MAQLEDAIRETVREEVRAVVREELARLLPHMLVRIIAKGGAEMAAGDVPDLPKTYTAEPVQEGTGGDDEGAAVHLSDPPAMDSRGRIIVDDAFIERVAREYLEAEAEGLHPNKALQERYGRSRSAVSHWLRQARESGLLESNEES